MNHCICLGAYFYKFVIADTLLDLHASLAVLKDMSLESSIGYQINPVMYGLGIEDKFQKIAHLDLEFINLFKDSPLYKKDRNAYLHSVNDFIDIFDLKDTIVYKGDFPYSNWFSNDGVDFFYLIMKKNILWILGFYESD